jgi:hypothetical protein
MKVRLRYDYLIGDLSDEQDQKPYIFEKGKEYEVVYQFEHEEYGLGDHTVYVIINEHGESTSLSVEVCDEVQND